MTENSPRPATAAVSGATRQRASRGKRWSASSTIEWLGADRETIARDPDASTRPPGAVKARVHYRLDGVTKRPTFPVSTTAELDVLRAFVATLALAYHRDWPADAAGKPVAPTSLPTVANIFEEPTESKVSLAGLLDPTASTHLDAELLVKMFRQHQRASKKKCGGGNRKRGTQYGYDKHHDFFLAHARYKPGDPRLDVLGLTAGASWVFDNQSAPITTTDLLHLVAVRATTNLRTRGVNERRLAKWETALEGATGGPALVPAMPELLPEEVEARTVEAFAQQLGAMLTFAHNYGHLPNALWTQRVQDEVPHAAATGYTTRTVPDRDKVADIVTSMRSHTRSMRGRDAITRDVDGDRYAAVVWVAGRLGSRPEETIAIRDSWVVLDSEDPRIVLRHAEIIQPALDGQPRQRVEVSLKGRAAGEVRVLRPAECDRAEFIEVLSRHRRDHIDREGGPDQHFFTTHLGAPVDLSNWNDDWWKPVRDVVFSGDPYLADMPFRRLRAAAVTDWLFVLGWTTAEAAEMAGHSQAILEKHYKGVLAERSPSPHRPGRATVASQTTPVDAEAMTSAQIAERKEVLRAELAAARAEFERLQEAERAQFDLLG